MIPKLGFTMSLGFFSRCYIKLMISSWLCVVWFCYVLLVVSLIFEVFGEWQVFFKDEYVQLEDIVRPQNDLGKLETNMLNLII